MSAESPILERVDSAVAGVDDGPTKPAAPRERRKSSAAPGVMNISELAESKTEIKIAPETQKLGWKLNDSVNNVDDPAYLKKMLTEPPIKRIDLKFPMGLEVTARNLKGVTIKDALDAIHKQFKKKADDELEEPYLKGFEWDPEESWTSLKVHQSKVSTVSSSSGGKKNKKKDKEAAEE